MIINASLHGSHLQPSSWRMNYNAFVKWLMMLMK